MSGSEFIGIVRNSSSEDACAIRCIMAGLALYAVCNLAAVLIRNHMPKRRLEE